MSDPHNSTQIVVQLLYERIDQTGRRVVAALVTSWLFSALSLYFSVKTDHDWFSRSGSIMCLFGAASAFTFGNQLHRSLLVVLKEGIINAERDLTLEMEPAKRYQRVLYFAYLTGIFGTLIWGYGDLLPKIL